jgi:hypothetical protein
MCRRACWWLVLLLAALPAEAAGRAEPKSAGFVDGTKLAELVGDEAVTVEITLGSAILKPLFRADPELAALGGGIESIYALVLDIDSPAVADQAVRQIRDIERGLLERGWERVARVRESDEEVKVLVLAEDEETFGGLVVTVIDRSSGGAEIVFANIAGKIDLAAIESIGERFDVPGLGDLELERPEPPKEKSR